MYRITRVYVDSNYISIYSQLKKEKTGERIKKIEPDIIVITGDLIDYKRSDKDIAIKLISQIKEIAPIYFVKENHEWWSGKAKILEKELIQENVTILNNKIISISSRKSEIALMTIS